MKFEDFDEKFLARFWNNVAKSAEDECWMWTGSVDIDGYGQVGFRGKQVKSHRVALILAGGAFTPEKPLTRHLCNTPGCCRPDHIVAGSAAENTSDMINARRHGAVTCPERVPRGYRNGSWTRPERVPRGESHGNSKLTTEKVIEIRKAVALGIPQKALVAKYGVVKSVISAVVKRQIWKHVA